MPPKVGVTYGRKAPVGVTSGKKAPVGVTSGKKTPVASSKRIIKAKDKIKKEKKRKLDLKGWLQTPADWARFDAWVKINAQPRKIPEPEAIIRPSKPICQLRKRLKVLAQPRKQPDPRINCCLELRISRATLCAKPSRRTLWLSLPNVRLIDFGREIGKISSAALRYVASERIIALSQPKGTITDEDETERSPCMVRTKRSLERLRQLAMRKKCPNALTEEEIEELYTPMGVRKSALTYKFTSWMFLLALPTYKSLKDRKDADAKAWKKMIITEGDERGKYALSEHIKRERERRRRLREKRKKKEICDDDMAEEKEDAEKRFEAAEEVERDEEEVERDEEEAERDEEQAEEGGDETEKGEEETEMDVEQKEKRGGDEKMKRRRKERKKKRMMKIDREVTAEEERRAKKRKIEKHAWRFQPPPCKDDPFSVRKEALAGEVSPRMTELAEPNVRKDQVTRIDPFKVKKGALAATPSARVGVLAQPNRPRSPVERAPPREKDEYGMPIFEKPAYGKVLPKTKPYQMGECPPPKEKKIPKKRPIDPIIYEPTIDPCIFPRLARIQKRERKRAEKTLKKWDARRRREKKKQIKESTSKVSEQKAEIGRKETDVDARDVEEGVPPEDVDETEEQEVDEE